MAGRFFDNDEIPKNFAWPSSPCPDVKWPSGVAPKDNEGQPIPEPQVNLGPQYQMQMAQLLEWMSKINVGDKFSFDFDVEGEWKLGTAADVEIGLANAVAVGNSVEVKLLNRVDFVAKNSEEGPAVVGQPLTVALTSNPPDDDHHTVEYTMARQWWNIKAYKLGVGPATFEVDHQDTVEFKAAGPGLTVAHTEDAFGTNHAVTYTIAAGASYLMGNWVATGDNDATTTVNHATTVDFEGDNGIVTAIEADKVNIALDMHPDHQATYNSGTDVDVSYAFDGGKLRLFIDSSDLEAC